MKNTMTNAVHLEGLVYQHDLKKKVSGPNSKNPNTEFITGTLDIATNDALTNVVQVHFTYVTATTGKGTANATFEVLNNIIEGNIGTVMSHGADKAGKIRVDTAIAVNDFYTDRNGRQELVSAKRNEGGFVHVVSALNEDEKIRNSFKADVIITQVIDVDGDEETQQEPRVVLKGYVFDFRKALVPVDFIVTSPGAMEYFRSLGATVDAPVFTLVKGTQISETIVIKKEEEGAFGTSVTEVKRNRKGYLVNWAQLEPYLWNDETTITEAELTKAKADRDIYLATVKKNQEEYRANRNNAAASPMMAPTTGAKQGFNF